MSKLTQATLKELLEYDPKTGVFTWKRRSSSYFKSQRSFNMWNTKYAGKVAGADWTEPRYKKLTYRQICVVGENHLAHRLAWLYMTGGWPENGVDHDDGNGLNNRWKNLRAATQSQNLANRSANKSNKTGFKGVSPCKRTGKYVAQINVKGKNIFLGRHKTKEQAAAAYNTAAVEHFGEFAKVNEL